MKVLDVKIALQRSPLKRPSVYLKFITEFISLPNGMKGTFGCSKTARCVTHHGAELWPPCLPDLSLQDSFRLGYSNNVTFRNNPYRLYELKGNIFFAMLDINSYTFHKV
ncbi:UNVERIFIED_CONTAM: hypothetical protein NCL1_33395 [Trichonephila clavipes]